MRKLSAVYGSIACLLGLKPHPQLGSGESPAIIGHEIIRHPQRRGAGDLKLTIASTRPRRSLIDLIKTFENNNTKQHHDAKYYRTKQHYILHL